MIRRYAYLRDEGFTVAEAVRITNAESPSEAVRLIEAPIPPPRWANPAERTTAPLAGRLACRLVLVIVLCATVWVWGRVAASDDPRIPCRTTADCRAPAWYLPRD